MVELLLDHRVDSCIVSNDGHLGSGKTATQLACFYKYPDIAEIIESHSRNATKKKEREIGEKGSSS